MAKKTAAEVDPEITAISEVYSALKRLEPDAQSRVLSYVAGKLNLAMPTGEAPNEQRDLNSSASHVWSSQASPAAQDDDTLESVSPVGKKWIARNGLQTRQLSSIFSLGVEEIDLIAKRVPGKNMKDRMHSVFLLKGIAAYLSSGAARFTHEQIKEACLHYDAFEATNFAKYIKSLASEVTGSREAGYTLSSRGLTNATEMVKQMAQSGTAP